MRLSFMLPFVACSALFSCRQADPTHTIPHFTIQNHLTVLTGDTSFDKGVSAPFGGMLGNRLILAGGCNFPHLPVANGGSKVYYKGIYAKEVVATDQAHWLHIADLPHAMAYGASFQDGDRLIFVGGMGDQGAC